MGMEILLSSIAIGPFFYAGGLSADHIKATDPALYSARTQGTDGRYGRAQGKKIPPEPGEAKSEG
jgi:hypothetical protein